MAGDRLWHPARHNGRSIKGGPNEHDYHEAPYDNKLTPFPGIVGDDGNDPQFHAGDKIAFRALYRGTLSRTPLHSRKTALVPAERIFLAWIRADPTLTGFGFVIARFALCLGTMRLDQVWPFGRRRTTSSGYPTITAAARAAE